jgi:hypothetical protein
MSSTVSTSSLTKIDVMRIFQEKLVAFFDALIELLPKEGDLIILRVMFANQIPIENAIKIFGSRIIPYADMVKNKDERFFIECTDIFSGIRKDKVSYFKDLWQSGTLTDDDKLQLWKWFNLFLNLALKFEKF